MNKIMGILMLLVFACIATNILSGGSFVIPFNLQNLMVRTSLFGIIGIGVAFVIITGGIDLSIGSMIGLIGCLMTITLIDKELGIVPTLLIVLGVSILLGFVHGLLITKAHLQPFVVTLCGLLIYRGVARWITGDSTGGFGKQYNDSLRLLATGKPFSTAAVFIVIGIAVTLFCIYKIVQMMRKSEGKPLNWIIGAVISICIAISGASRFKNVSETQVLQLSKGTSVNIMSKRDPTKLDISKFDADKPGRRPSQFMPEILLNYVGYLAIPLAVSLAFVFLKRDTNTALLSLGLLISGATLTLWASSYVSSLFEERKDVGLLAITEVIVTLGIFIAGVDRFLKGVYRSLPEYRGLLSITCILSLCWLVSQTPICRTLVPTPMVFLAAISTAAAIFLNKTIYGRYLLALGNNESAARLSGINTDRMIILAYVICAFCTAIGGILFALDGNSIQPANHGNFYELYAIAAAVLGGCSLRGGEGSIAGVVIGAAVMRVLYNSITLLKIPTSLEFAIIGVVIMIGVLADEFVKKLNHAKRQQEEVERANLVEE